MNKERMIKEFEYRARYYSMLSNWSNALNELSIQWLYLPWMTPETNPKTDMDFYLPLQGVYLNMAVDVRSIVEKFHSTYDKPIIYGYEDGTFQMWGKCWEEWEIASPSDSWLSKCEQCENYFFLNSNGSFMCEVCNAYEGDHHLGQTYYGDESLFTKIWGNEYS